MIFEHTMWDHSFGISPVAIDCWKRWANTGPNSVASSFRTLGWNSSGPKSFKRVQAVEKFYYSVLRNNNIIHERCRHIQKRDLGVFIFIEYIRKLTIEFLCLFEVRLSNTLSILPFQEWNTLCVFFLIIYVTIEVSGVCLNITNQVIHIQIILFSYIFLKFQILI